MELYQKHPVWGFTRFTTTADGLLVERKRLTNYLYTEIPYEELLPVRGKMEKSFPLLLSFFVAFAVVGSWFQEMNKLFPSEEHFFVMYFVTILVAALCYFTYTRWQNAFIITTGWGNISLAAQPGMRDDMLQFVEDLRAQTKAYLRQRYAHPALYIDKDEHFSRYDWLYERKVISLEEYQQLLNQSR